MKKNSRIIVLSLVVIIGGAFTYWQIVKKSVIKQAVKSAITNQSDSLYYIHYESSNIDEINGNASFTKIVLQSDSLQEILYSNDSAVTANIFNVHIEQLKITGANIPSFLQKNILEAKSISIIRPVITIIKTGKDETFTLSSEDSMALYDKLTGRFKSIQAGEINIVDATIAFAHRKQSPHTSLQGVNIHLKNLKIDSTRNYDNIISYFIKDVVATVKSINIKDVKNDRQFIIENASYDAPGRFINIGRILQKKNSTGKTLIDLNGSSIRGISTQAFIIHKQIKADSLISNGGTIIVYRSKKQPGLSEELSIDNNFFEEAHLKNIRLGSSLIQIYNKEKPGEAPLVLKNLRFTANGIDSIYDGSRIKNLLANSKWRAWCDGLNFISKDNKYKIIVGPYELDKQLSTIRIKHIIVQPLLSEQAFVNSLKVQKDRFNIKLSNIEMKGADLGALMNSYSLIAEQISLQPDIQIFNDRTVKADTSSKLGHYPQQELMQLDIPVYIKKLVIKNGYVAYKERGALSKQVGNVFFNNLNATLVNISNIKEKIAANNTMVLNANTKFLGIAALHTTWQMQLASKNGSFSVSGQVKPFDASKLSVITEPLGVATIKKGSIKQLNFKMKGDDLNSAGIQTLLYDDLKIRLLKTNADSSETLQKKKLLSFVANIFTQDKNPSGGIIRQAKIEYKRDVSKSFFNLLWQSIFAAAKRTASGKNDL